MAAIMHHFILSLMYIREHTTLILRELNFDSSLLCSFIHGCVASDTSLSRSSARTESWESRPPEPPSVLRHLPGVRAIRFLGSAVATARWSFFVPVVAVPEHVYAIVPAACLHVVVAAYIVVFFLASVRVAAHRRCSRDCTVFFFPRRAPID